MEHVPEEVQLWQNLEISQPFLNKHFSLRQKTPIQEDSFSEDANTHERKRKNAFFVVPPSGDACAGANNAKRERYL